MAVATRRPTLLVTRPADGAARFAAAAEAAGFATLIDPMLTIAAVPADPAELRDVQAVLITSAAAAKPLGALLQARTVPVLAVGDASADAVRREGFDHVESAGGDVTALAELAASRLDPAGGDVVHVGGAQRAGDLVGDLSRRGFRARALVLYKARPAERLNPATARALAAGKIDYAAFFSPQTARTFASVAAVSGVTSCLSHVTAVAISAAAGDALADLEWRRLLTAAEPNATSLLARLSASISGAALEDGAGQAE